MRQTQEKGWTFGPAPKRKNRNRNYAQLKVFLRRVPRKILGQALGQIFGQVLGQALGQPFGNAFIRGSSALYLPKNTDVAACQGHSSTLKVRLWAICCRASRASRWRWGEKITRSRAVLFSSTVK